MSILQRFEGHMPPASRYQVTQVETMHEKYLCQMFIDGVTCESHILFFHVNQAKSDVC